MKECKKKSTTAEQFDSALIFARTQELMNSRDIKVEHILSYELAPVPIMCDEKMLRVLLSKSQLLYSGSIQACNFSLLTCMLFSSYLICDANSSLWVVISTDEESFKSATSFINLLQMCRLMPIYGQFSYSAFSYESTWPMPIMHSTVPVDVFSFQKSL